MSPVALLSLIIVYYIMAFFYDKKIQREGFKIGSSKKQSQNDINHLERGEDIKNELISITTNNISQFSFGNKQHDSSIKQMEFDDFETEQERENYLQNINEYKNLGLSEGYINTAARTPMEFEDIVSQLN